MEKDEPVEVERSESHQHSTLQMTPKDTRVLRASLRKMIEDCSKDARRSYWMVVFSILACITVLLLGNKVDSLFVSSAERRAMKRIEEAKYKILEKVASLDDRAIDDIDVIYEEIRSNFGLNLIAPRESPNIECESAQTDAKATSTDVEPPPPKADLDAPLPPTYTDVEEITLPIEQYDELKDRVTLLTQKRDKLEAKIEALEGLTDKTLRDQTAFYSQRIEQLQSELTSCRSDLHEAEKKRDALWKSRESLNRRIGELQRDVADGSAMEHVKSMVSTVFIQGGALVLLVWLVKIFVRKHQHAINAKEYYNALLHALQIKGLRTLDDFQTAVGVLYSGTVELRDADVNLPSSKLGAAFMRIAGCDVKPPG